MGCGGSGQPLERALVGGVVHQLIPGQRLRLRQQGHSALLAVLVGMPAPPRLRGQQAIEQRMRQALQQVPGVRSKVGLGGSGEKYILVLTGEDPQALQTAAMAVERDLRTIQGLGSIASTASLVRPEIAVRPDFAKAADLGVTSAAISDTLRVATLGDYDAALPKLNLSQRQVPIVVRLDADAASSAPGREPLFIVSPV